MPVSQLYVYGAMCGLGMVAALFLFITRRLGLSDAMEMLAAIPFAIVAINVSIRFGGRFRKIAEPTE